MEILRAPDARFADLSGFAYEPRYATFLQEDRGPELARVAAARAGNG